MPHGHPAPPLANGVDPTGDRPCLVDGGHIGVGDRRGLADGGEEIAAARLARIRAEHPDQHRAVERGVDRQPLLDVMVAAQPDLEAVAVWERGRHGTTVGACCLRGGDPL